MDSHNDTSTECEQSCGVNVSSSDVHPWVVEEYDEQLIIPRREGDPGLDERLHSEQETDDMPSV